MCNGGLTLLWDRGDNACFPLVIVGIGLRTARKQRHGCHQSTIQTSFFESNGDRNQINITKLGHGDVRSQSSHNEGFRN